MKIINRGEFHYKFRTNNFMQFYSSPHELLIGYNDFRNKRWNTHYIFTNMCAIENVISINFSDSQLIDSIKYYKNFSKIDHICCDKCKKLINKLSYEDGCEITNISHIGTKELYEYFVKYVTTEEETYHRITNNIPLYFINSYIGFDTTLHLCLDCSKEFAKDYTKIYNEHLKKESELYSKYTNEDNYNI